MKQNSIKEKKNAFSLQFIKLDQYLINELKEFVIAKQILRYGTCIEENFEESTGAQSKKDFIAKLYLSLKEAKETHYWLRLLNDSKIVDAEQASNSIKHCEELIIILVSILKTAKE